MLIRTILQGKFAVVFSLALMVLLSGCATKGDGMASPFGAGKSGTPGIWPIRHPEATISSPFGMRVQPGTGKTRLHKGVDIRVPEGTPAHVTADGVVTFSGQQGDYGNVIVVEHGGDLATAYAHLKKRRVDQGQQVRRGQHIGDVGKTGNATAPHLHYEVRRGGQPVDPMPYLPR